MTTVLILPGCVHAYHNDKETLICLVRASNLCLLNLGEQTTFAANSKSIYLGNLREPNYM